MSNFNRIEFASFVGHGGGTLEAQKWWQLGAPPNIRRFTMCLIIHLVKRSSANFVPKSRSVRVDRGHNGMSARASAAAVNVAREVDRNDDEKGERAFFMFLSRGIKVDKTSK